MIGPSEGRKGKKNIFSIPTPLPYPFSYGMYVRYTWYSPYPLFADYKQSLLPMKVT